MSSDNIVRDLEAALSRRDLPDSAQARGNALFEILSRPVRVALVGPKGAGKSALLNLFLGEKLLPNDLGVGITEIVPGEAFVAEASYEDGTLEAPEEDELGDLDGAERLLIAAPYPILEKIALLEARSDDQSALAEIVLSADIVLWCTTKFEKTERETWSKFSSEMSDHAFLALTKADKLARKGRLAEVMTSLSGPVSGSFTELFPIATLQGLKAIAAKPRDAALWDGSGAEALVNAVLDHASKGRQADLDQAELFLARYAVDAESDEGEPGRTRSRPRSRMRSVIVKKRSRPTRESSPRPAVSSPRADSPSKVAALAQEQPKPAVSKSQPTPNALGKGPGDTAAPAKEAPSTLANRLLEVRQNLSRPVKTTTSVTERALTKLLSTAERLRGAAEDPAKVLTICVDTADALQSIFDEADIPENLKPISDDLAGAAEMMTLLQLENAPGPAADAVTILLQLKRDFEQTLAA